MKIPTTENAAETWSEPFSVREAMLPPKLRALRQKLKAKANLGLQTL